MRIVFIIILSSALTISSALYASDKYNYEHSLSSADVTSDFSGTKSRVNIDIAKDQKKATFKFKGWGTNFDGSDRVFDTASTFIEVKAPFDKEAKESSVALGDELANATTITFGVDFKKFEELKTNNQSVSDNRLLCHKYLLEQKHDTCSFGQVKTQAGKVFKPLTTAEKIQMCRAYGISLDICDDKSFPTKLAEKYEEESRSVWGKHTEATIIPVRLEYGQQNFNYLDLNSFNDVKTKENPYSVRIAYGWLTHNRLLSIGIEILEGYSESNKQDYCTPVSGSLTASSCTPKFFGPPSKKESENIYFEARYRPEDKNYAIGFKLTHDTEDDEQYIEVPVYLIEAVDKGLCAGLKFKWDSVNEEVSSSFFFGTSFSFFK